MIEETKTTANLSTDTPAEDTGNDNTVSTEERDLGKASQRVGRDKYQQEVDQILAKHAAQKKGETVEDETLREGESWDSVYNNAPPEVQRAMASLRADYTRKTQELAAQRKQVKESAEQVRLQQLALQDNAAYKAIQQAAQADAGEFDPYDTASFERYVDKMVAQRLQAVLAPMAEQQMKNQAQSKIQSFMAEHPELQTDEALRSEVKEVLLSNQSYSLQDAYWIVQGRRSHQSSERAQLEQMAFKSAAKRAGLQVGIGQNKGTTIPKGAASMKANELYEHLLRQKK
jgi:hypothetical protein